ncbi:battenin, partial [Hemiscyllium ocellatum]|uniref:battenin n=1 Tax=Hemiscyllium ocellatum TaxID=170820 RepID=UPI00296714F3
SSVSCWSSGTGAAGLLGALSYSGLTQSGLCPRNTVLLMVIVPIVLCSSYMFLLVKPPRLRVGQDPLGQGQQQEEEEGTPIMGQHGPHRARYRKLTFREKLTIVQSLLKYMVPLGTVYFAEYFINQGLLELMFYRNIFLDHNAQYRWYQTIYQLGVFLSRSSAECVHLRRIWILAVLQFLNIVFLAANVWTIFVPTIWIIFILILYEGMLGGAAYVNTFRNISIEVPDEHREFAMGAACVADTLGIAISGAIAVPLHDYLCRLA